MGEGTPHHFADHELIVDEQDHAVGVIDETLRARRIGGAAQSTGRRGGRDRDRRRGGALCSGLGVIRDHANTFIL
jgi:hypothetical protein